MGTTRWKSALRAIYATEFNLEQFVHCELSPASLLPLECWFGNNPHNEDTKELIHFFLLMQVFNVTTKGKVSVAMWEFLQDYLNILLGFCEVPTENATLGVKSIELYEKGLVHMATKYLKTDRMLEFLASDHKNRSHVETEAVGNVLLENKELYALTRLAAMSSAYTDASTRVVTLAFKYLKECERKVLVVELCQNGIVDGYTIHLFHAPKMLQNIMGLHNEKQPGQSMGSKQDAAASVKLQVDEGHAIERMRQGFSILSEAYRQSRELLKQFLRNVKYDDEEAAQSRPNSRNCSTALGNKKKAQAGALSKNQNGVFDVNCYALGLCPPRKIRNSKIDIQINWSVQESQMQDFEVPPSAECNILHKW